MALEQQIHAGYTDQLREATRRLTRDFRVRGAITVISLVVGGGVSLVAPPVGPVAGTAIRLGAGVIAKRLAEPRWLAFDRLLRKVTER